MIIEAGIKAISKAEAYQAVNELKPSMPDQADETDWSDSGPAEGIVEEE
jgi:hypothetical protein